MHPLLAFYLRTFGVVVGGIIAIVGIPIGLLVFVASGLGEAMCGNSPLSEIVSPSGQLKAVVFERNCGATTGFVTHLSITEAKSSLQDDGGNVFAADTDHGRAPAGRGGGPEIRVVWLGERHLRVEHHALARIFKSRPEEKGVKVEYAVFPPNG